MSEIGPTQIVYGILALIIIVSFLFVGVYSFSTTARNFVDKLIDFMGEDEPVVETPESMQAEQQFYNQFLVDYQKCKSSPDTGCVCNTRPIYIPEGHYLEITNHNKVTSMSMTLGTININPTNLGITTPPRQTDRRVSEFKSIIGEDIIGVIDDPLRTGSGVQYLDDSGNLQLGDYRQVSNIFLFYDDLISRGSLYNPDTYSQTRLLYDATGEVSGVTNFNLKGIYKLNNKMVFIQSPGTSSIGSSEVVERGNAALAQQFRSLPKCRDTIPGYEEAKETFDDFAAGISQIILSTRNQQLPSQEAQIIAEASLIQLWSQSTNLQNNFKIKVYPKYIALFEGNKELFKRQLEISKDQTSGRTRSSTSWEVINPGVCSYGLNVVPHRAAQKSYSSNEGYELNKDTKKVSIYLTDADELCFVAYDAEHLTIATTQ